MKIGIIGPSADEIIPFIENINIKDSILTEHHPCMKTNNFNADSELINVCKGMVIKNAFIQKIYFGKIVTGEAFISEEGRDVIKSRYAPLCVDMESASIAHVCYVNNIPFLAIRTITDTEENSGIEVFEENCISASLNSIELLKLLLKDLRIYKFNKCL